jgi:MerR family transcriptional regulator, thiopeptide resistance regulator
MPSDALKVGELARRTGLTIRTLHHYDEIGLLKPSLHSGSGHRLYTLADVGRLQQILSLRQLGFSLEQIGECLKRAEFSPVEVIRLHLERLTEQIELQRKLRERLTGLLEFFRAAKSVSADDFLKTIEVITMIENYYTPEQMEYLKQRREQLGEEAINKGTQDWADLIADFKAAMESGVDPSDPSLEPLRQRHRALIEGFTGGNPGVADSLKRMWQEQGSTMNAQFGYDPKVMEFMGKAASAS